MDPIGREQRFPVNAGAFDDAGSWVYLWRTDDGRVAYVGATWMPPKVRAWLHVHHDDPDLGRIRAQHPELVDQRVEVVAFEVAGGIDRQQVRQALTSIVAAEEPDPALPRDAVEAAVAIAARVYESR